jgi:hypothetical protein
MNSSYFRDGFFRKNTGLTRPAAHTLVFEKTVGRNMWINEVLMGSLAG